LYQNLRESDDCHPNGNCKERLKDLSQTLNYWKFYGASGPGWTVPNALLNSKLRPLGVTTRFIMKYCCLFFVCLVTSKAWCQDSTVLISWNKLTSAFVKRATTFENITLSVSKIIKVDSSSIKDITERKIALESLSGDSDRLDSSLIQQVAEENEKLIASFSILMQLINSDPTFASRKEATDIQVQLMAAENRIFSAKKQYNALVNSKNRKDLLYP
jgi:hypothetical protein